MHLLALVLAFLLGFLASQLMGLYDTHSDEKFKKQVLNDLLNIRITGGQNKVLLHEVLRLLRQKPILTKGIVTIMPKQIQVGETAQAVLKGVDQNGNAFPLDATYVVTPTASAPSDVNVGPVSPDGSFQLTGVAADSADSIGAQITRPDGVVLTATPDILTILAPPPVLTSVTVSLQ